MIRLLFMHEVPRGRSFYDHGHAYLRPRMGPETNGTTVSKQIPIATEMFMPFYEHICYSMAKIRAC
jgi:hypothetical protein